MPEKKTNFQKWKDGLSFRDFVHISRTDCLNCPIYDDCLSADRCHCFEHLAEWALTECED